MPTGRHVAGGQRTNVEKLTTVYSFKTKMPASTQAFKSYNLKLDS
jgi:hypothetical protein